MRYQPQGRLAISNASPLAVGMRLASLPGVIREFDAATGRMGSSTGIKQVGCVHGVAGGFSTAGHGTSDRAVTPLKGPFPSTGRSYYVRALRKGAGGNSLGRLFDKTNGTSGQMLYWNNSTSTFRYQTYTSDTSTNANGDQIVDIAGSATTSGEFFDLFVTHADDGAVMAYFNGALLVSKVMPGTLKANDGALAIGNRATDTLRVWDGLIESTFIWDRVLSAEEIAKFRTNPWQLFVDPEEDDDSLAAASGDPSGTIAATLAGAILSASGALVNAGSFSSTLLDATMSASGSASDAPSGSFSTSLSGVSFSATGSVLNAGTLSSALAGATSSFAGNVSQSVTGTFGATLDGATMSAYEAAPLQANRRYRPRILRRHFTN